MSKVIAYRRPDGGISICNPMVSRDDPADFTADDALARALAKDVPKDAANVEVIDKAVVPADRTFRDAWALTGKAIGHDMAKARAIHLARLRAERDAKLAATDGLMARANERGDAAERARLMALRQRLRDMPVDIEAELAGAKDVAALKAVRPSVLDEGP